MEEDDITVEDDINEKGFEDYLYGNSSLDKSYQNRKVWVECPYRYIRLEPCDFSNQTTFLEVLGDYCIYNC